MQRERKDRRRGRLSAVLNKAADVLLLGLISFVCSLPVLTLGAAATAFYGVGMDLIRDREGSPYRDYFRIFSKRFSKSTRVWLVFLALSLLLAGNSVFYLHMAEKGAVWAQFGLGVCFAAAVLLSLAGSFLFPLLAVREDLSFWETVKIAFYLSVADLGPWAAKAGIGAAVAAACWFVPFLLLFAPGALLWSNCYFANRVLKKHFPNFMEP